MQTKPLIIILIGLALFFASCRQKEQPLTLQMAVEHQMDIYPESRLQDIYKSFYQDHFGPGHLITDTATVRYYLYSELSENDVSYPFYYEPTGCEGRFVRVFLSAVSDSLVSAEELLDAFIRSANEFKEPETEWVNEWAEIVRTIRENEISVEGFDVDEPLLTEAAQDNQAAHHSRAYNAAYHPHYRIVRRDIFEKEIKPKLEGKK
jgi:hypothetical protein